MHIWKARKSTFSWREVCFFMFNRIKDKWLHRKWTLYLFYDGVMIKKVKIDENTDITKQVFYIKVIGHKHLFGKNIINIMVKPIRLLKTEEQKKRTYWGVKNELGVEV